MAEPTLQALAEDLRTFDAEGANARWAATDCPLPAIEALQLVREHVEGGAMAVTPAVKRAIEAACDAVEADLRAVARAHFGFTETTRWVPAQTGRYQAAARERGTEWESTYRRPQSKLALDGRERAWADITIERVAEALAGLEREARARAEQAQELAAAGELPDLDHRSELPPLASVWGSLTPIDLARLQALAASELKREVRSVLAHLYRSYRLMRDDQTFLSLSTALALREKCFDEEDWAYVVSRLDAQPGFRSQHGWDGYLAGLRRRVRPTALPGAVRSGERDGVAIRPAPEEGVRQVRVVVAEDEDAAARAIAETAHLHRSGTLFFLRRSRFEQYERLRHMRYGLQISTRHRYAMISVPPGLTPGATSVRHVADLVERCAYDASEGDMRAIVTAAPAYVEGLREEFEDILASPDAVCLPSGAAVLEGGAER